MPDTGGTAVSIVVNAPSNDTTSINNNVMRKKKSISFNYKIKKQSLNRSVVRAALLQNNTSLAKRLNFKKQEVKRLRDAVKVLRQDVFKYRTFIGSLMMEREKLHTTIKTVLNGAIPILSNALLEVNTEFQKFASNFDEIFHSISEIDVKDISYLQNTSLVAKALAKPKIVRRNSVGKFRKKAVNLVRPMKQGFVLGNPVVSLSRMRSGLNLPQPSLDSVLEDSDGEDMARDVASSSDSSLDHSDELQVLHESVRSPPQVRTSAPANVRKRGRGRGSSSANRGRAVGPASTSPRQQPAAQVTPRVPQSRHPKSVRGRRAAGPSTLGASRIDELRRETFVASPSQQQQLTTPCRVLMEDIRCQSPALVNEGRASPCTAPQVLKTPLLRLDRISTNRGASSEAENGSESEISVAMQKIMTRGQQTNSEPKPGTSRRGHTRKLSTSTSSEHGDSEEDALETIVLHASKRTRYNKAASPKKLRSALKERGVVADSVEQSKSDISSDSNLQQDLQSKQSSPDVERDTAMMKPRDREVTTKRLSIVAERIDAVLSVSSRLAGPRLSETLVEAPRENVQKPEGTLEEEPSFTQDSMFFNHLPTVERPVLSEDLEIFSSNSSPETEVSERRNTVTQEIDLAEESEDSLDIFDESRLTSIPSEINPSVVSSAPERGDMEYESTHNAEDVSLIEDDEKTLVEQASADVEIPKREVFDTSARIGLPKSHDSSRASSKSLLQTIQPKKATRSKPMPLSKKMKLDSRKKRALESDSSEETAGESLASQASGNDAKKAKLSSAILQDSSSGDSSSSNDSRLSPDERRAYMENFFERVRNEDPLEGTSKTYGEENTKKKPGPASKTRASFVRAAEAVKKSLRVHNKKNYTESPTTPRAAKNVADHSWRPTKTKRNPSSKKKPGPKRR